MFATTYKEASRRDRGFVHTSSYLLITTPLAIEHTSTTRYKTHTLKMHTRTLAKIC